MKMDDQPEKGKLRTIARATTEQASYEKWKTTTRAGQRKHPDDNFPGAPPRPPAGRTQTKKPEFRQKANKFKPNGHLGAEVSVPNVVRKYAIGGIFKTLQKKRAAAPEPMLQTKMKKIQI